MNAWRPACGLIAAALLSLATAGCRPAGNAPGMLSPLAQPVLPWPQTAKQGADQGAEQGADAVSTPWRDAGQAAADGGGAPGELLNAILADAARRTGVDADALTVTRADAVTWRDGALGCPEPGMYYTQMLVNGYWIVVETETQRLDYRAQANGYFRLCEQPGGEHP